MEEPPKIEEETKTCKVGANKHGLNHSISISTQENVPLQLEQKINTVIVHEVANSNPTN